MKHIRSVVSDLSQIQESQKLKQMAFEEQNSQQLYKNSQMPYYHVPAEGEGNAQEVLEKGTMELHTWKEQIKRK